MLRFAMRRIPIHRPKRHRASDSDSGRPGRAVANDASSGRPCVAAELLGPRAGFTDRAGRAVAVIALLLGLLSTSGCSDPAIPSRPVDELSRTLRALRRRGVHVQEVVEPRLSDRPCWLARVFAEHFDRNDRLDDDLLQLLAKVPQLIVEIRFPEASDAAVVELADRVPLLGLAAEATKITARSLRTLGRVRSLRLLKVDDTGLPAAAFVHLRNLEQMRMLYASHTGLDDSVAAWLKRWRDLRALKLAFTPITDAGVRSLAELPRLEFLGLRGTRITNASVPALLRLKRLRYLDVRETGLTREAIDELELYLEHCRVVSDIDTATVRRNDAGGDPFRLGNEGTHQKPLDTNAPPEQ
ncbi:MAG: hypothetical protein D6725_10660 [Planctomycetota bacterium]|nr:MAG: hypothetical protein D6725_10660 [Planctomycetota bacterium]